MNKGVTIIEILLVIAIITIVLAISVVGFSALNARKALETDTIKIVSAFNDARSKTLSSKGPSQYGVHIEATEVVVFRGTSYSASDPENEVITLSPSSRITQMNLSSAGSDIIFSRLTGASSKSGTITVGLVNDPATTRLVTIYLTGIVEANL
jgi:prepilin-type N-terminal cleavage/methylation domain-containing protein